MKDPYSIPQTMQETYDTITALTDGFCAQKLNEEYADMCRQMCAKLCRKRPSPQASGLSMSSRGFRNFDNFKL